MMRRILILVAPFLPYRLVLLAKRTRGWVKAKLRRRTHVRVCMQDIARDLRRIGIQKGDVVLVHSSLGSIGFVEGGVHAVIDALMETVGSEGTVAMPCFTLHGSMLETLQRGTVFDPRKTVSTVGAITEAFRRRDGVRRSIHPTHSVCAWGAKAEWITRGHESAATSFGPGTPLHKIMEVGGFILGLGIGFGPVTFVHVIEDTLDDFPLDVYRDREYQVTVIDGSGCEKEMRLKAHDPEVARTRIDKAESTWTREFFAAYLSARGFLRTGYVGEARSWIVKAKDLFEVQKELASLGITIYTTQGQYERLCRRQQGE